MTAKLEEVRGGRGIYKPKNPLKSSKDYSIITSVQIIKPHHLLHLPLLDTEIKNTFSQQTLKLHAIGGSKKYEWISIDQDIVAIGHEAIVLPKSLGRTTIIVRDRLNFKNMDKIDIEISGVDQLVFLEKFKEIIVDDVGYVNLYAVGGSSQQRYSNCSFLSFDTSLDKADIAQNQYQK